VITNLRFRPPLTAFNLIDFASGAWQIEGLRPPTPTQLAALGMCRLLAEGFREASVRLLGDPGADWGDRIYKQLATLSGRC